MRAGTGWAIHMLSMEPLSCVATGPFYFLLFILDNRATLALFGLFGGKQLINSDVADVK